jgi:manganese/zinc/iron transport system permease protein
MMGAASGFLFVLAVLFAPRQGMVSKAVDRVRLSIKIVAEDILGILFRLEESGSSGAAPRSAREFAGTLERGPLRTWLALRQLIRSGRLAADAAGYRLSEAGRLAARDLIRSHRLWETYMAKHFNVPESGLHAAAERVEHYIDSPLQEKLADELDRPKIDPQGKSIPSQQHATETELRTGKISH